MAEWSTESCKFWKFCLTVSGSQYHGDVIHGDERHGKGVMYFPTGPWYEGSWEHDEMHGTDGKYYFANVSSLDRIQLTLLRAMCTKGPLGKMHFTEREN